MRKIVIIVFLMCIIFPINALPQVGFITAGVGSSFSSEKGNNLEFDINFLYLSYEFDGYFQKPNLMGLGITWIPVNYKYILNNHYWSFINFQLFWNVFALIKTENSYPYKANFKNTLVEPAIFGPFALINYAPNFDFNNYILSYGIRYNWTGIIESNRLYFFNIECGIRKFNNENNFYFNAGVDIIATSFLAIFKIAN